jgi:peroxiredoxin
VRTVAIVAQKPEAVREYEEQHRLPFSILIDGTREVIKEYGVYHRIGIDAWNIAHPALFLIGRDRHVMRSFIGARQTEFPTHDEVMRWIDETRAGSA